MHMSEVRGCFNLLIALSIFIATWLFVCVAFIPVLYLLTKCGVESNIASQAYAISSLVFTFPTIMFFDFLYWKVKHRRHVSKAVTDPKREFPPTNRSMNHSTSRKPKLKLHLLGYWAEWRYEALMAHPQDFVDPDWPEVERERIANYLSSGCIIESYEGYAVNRFRKGEDDDMHPEMGDSELTDGVYCWPEGLAVYVRKYSVRLPEFFHQHIREQNYIPPDHSQFEGKYEFDTSLRKWVNWTRRNRKSRLLAILSYLVPYGTIDLRGFFGEHS